MNSIPFHTPTLLCYNLSAVLLSHNPTLHVRTKHIELDIHFVREMVVGGNMLIQHVSVATQIADMLTNPLGTTTFQKL